jgi:hypothetical protein
MGLAGSVNLVEHRKIMSSYEHLLAQIDAFIRKFYKNQMIKGAFLFLLFFLISYLITTTLEYFGRFGSTSRAFLFFSFIAVNLYLLITYLLLPAAKLYSFGKRIDRYQASDIIGEFFPEISDRLRNTLLLNDSLNAQVGNLELIRASVVQRSKSLNVIPFTSAINLSANRKYVRYLIPLFVLFVVVGVASPELFREGTNRVVNYTQEFKPVAPFVFELQSSDLDIEEGDDLFVNVSLRGKDFPEQVYLISENGKILMSKIGRSLYSGTIKKPSNSGSFHFEANSFISSDNHYTVFGKSAIGRIQAKLHYPDYLGREDHIIENAGDMLVPEGTVINWSVKTKNTKRLDFVFNNTNETYLTQGFKTSTRISQNSRVGIRMFNNFRPLVDSSGLEIDVIKDAYPGLQLEEIRDSVSDGVRYFSGRVSDDYGLTSLVFVYTIISENGSKRTIRLPVSKVGGLEMPFDFAVDFRRENVQLNDRIEYFFVVYDNDGVNGNKSTKSQVFTYMLPSLEELNDKRESEQEKTKTNLSELLNRSEKFQKNVEKLKKDLLGAKNNDWNKLNKVQQLKDEQRSILESLQQMKQQMNKSVEEKNQLSEMDKDLLDKQDMIDKLLEDLMDDELKKLLEDLEKLMQKGEKEDLKDKIDDLEQNSENMKNQLDRSLELLKRLQVNEKIDDIEKELKQLSDEQDKLKNDMIKESLSEEQAKEKQDDLNGKFNELKEDLNELKELNKTLDQPYELGNTESKENEISNEMQEASQKLGSKKGKKASENQQNASKKMKELSEQMNMMQEMANQQQQEEDINTLRNVLESLMTLSFDQEAVMQRFLRVNDSDPSYRRYGRKQRIIMDETGVVRDSLMALAKRQPKIASFVDKELNTIRDNHELALEDIDEHRKRELNIHQQSVMTSYNNLALLLNESLQHMQEQMQESMKPGSGSCSNPNGKGKPKSGESMSMGDMKQMLKKQIEQMQKGLNPNGAKPGERPGQKEGQSGMGMPGLANKEIARMAAEQMAIRQRLEQLRNSLNKDGSGNGNKLNPLIKELEEQERDLVNKMFSNETLRRQKDILTRLLESESALMERGFEEKRESLTGKKMNYSNQIRFDEYNKQKLRQIELLRSVDPVFRKYYKDKANEYFNQQ